LGGTGLHVEVKRLIGVYLQQSKSTRRLSRWQQSPYRRHVF